MLGRRGVARGVSDWDVSGLVGVGEVLEVVADGDLEVPAVGFDGGDRGRKPDAVDDDALVGVDLEEVAAGTVEGLIVEFDGADRFDGVRAALEVRGAAKQRRVFDLPDGLAGVVETLDAAGPGLDLAVGTGVGGGGRRGEDAEANQEGGDETESETEHRRTTREGVRAEEGADATLRGEPAACNRRSGRSDLAVGGRVHTFAGTKRDQLRAVRESTMAATSSSANEVLLTGATGFIGRALYPALVQAGWDVRCASRHPHRARERWPDRRWVRMDVEDPASVRKALEGCGAAYYLIHQMADTADYERRETRAAMTFLDCASKLDVERIVYLGGVKPAGEPARHLRSRLVTGAILRSGPISTIELRASMVIGHGSTSWKIIRDIARRMPVMICPKWLRNRTQPLAVDDAVVALTAALQMETGDSRVYAVPGPQTLTFQACIRRAARQMGRNPLMIEVPVLSARLSSYWLRLVTGADSRVARALAEGLKDDLLASADELWPEIGHRELVSYDEAVRRALEVEDKQKRQQERIDAGEDSSRVTGGPRA